jgi:sec-independent protein translocase protein TatA
MGSVGPGEILLLLVLALLLFGAKRLPEIGRSLGKGMREFKDSVSIRERSEDELGPNERAAVERYRAEQRAAEAATPAEPALEGEVVSSDVD